MFGFRGRNLGESRQQLPPADDAGRSGTGSSDERCLSRGILAGGDGPLLQQRRHNFLRACAICCFNSSSTRTRFIF